MFRLLLVHLRVTNGSALDIGVFPNGSRIFHGLGLLAWFHSHLNTPLELKSCNSINNIFFIILLHTTWSLIKIVFTGFESKLKCLKAGSKIAAVAKVLILCLIF